VLPLQRQARILTRQQIRVLDDGQIVGAALDEGRITKNVGESGYPRRIEDLVDGVEDRKSPKRARIYFLRRLPRDPFNPDAALSSAATWGKRSYASPPDNPKEGDDVYDVFSLAPGKGINGLPYRDW